MEPRIQYAQTANGVDIASWTLGCHSVISTIREV
jgi:hypothetical protein